MRRGESKIGVSGGGFPDGRRLGVPVTDAAAGQAPDPRKGKQYLNPEMPREREIFLGQIIKNTKAEIRAKHFGPEATEPLDDDKVVGMWNDLTRDRQQHLVPGEEIGDDTRDQLVLKVAKRDPGFNSAVNELVLSHMPVVQRIARKYARRNSNIQEDLESVGYEELSKRAERYDWEIIPFIPYIIPSLEGRMKRFFRDEADTIKMPRRISDGVNALGKVIESLTVSLGTPPNVAQITAAMNEGIADPAKHYSRGDIEEFIAGTVDRNPKSLDEPISHEGNAHSTRGDLVADPDSDHSESVAVEVTLAELISTLPEREQQVVKLRYWGHMTQSEISKHVGVSQMHVSRLLIGVHSKLRTVIERETT